MIRPFAINEDAEKIYIDPSAARHMVIAGVTGSGKSVATQGILRGMLVPWVQIVGVDPSSSLLRPLQYYSERPADFVLGDHEGWVDDALALLRSVYSLMRERIAQLGWSEKISSYTAEIPVVVCVLEEYANFLAELDRIDKKRRSEAENLVSSILREGRKVGILCMTILQRAEAKILNDRAQYGLRVIMRQDNGDSVKMMIDDPDRDTVARIRTLSPGQGVFQRDGQPPIFFLTPEVEYQTYVLAIGEGVYPYHAPIRKENAL